MLPQNQNLPTIEPFDRDTIVAKATPVGRGAIAVVRVSGPACRAIAKRVFTHVPKPRTAELVSFHDEQETVIDQGIALFFQGPYSFTGEDVLEFQGHGGPVVVDHIIHQITKLGARLARPGEFTERAFLNDKIDLVQAEAIADLIQAHSVQAAKAAMQSLTGVFSQLVDQCLEKLVFLRMMVESAIDFSEEEIDFLAEERVHEKLSGLAQHLAELVGKSQQGALLSQGIKVVIAGKPNAGKSSLLNALTEDETAIVTDIPGTTRDVIKENIVIDGLPIQLFDTAGLRDSPDRIEQEGIARAKQALKRADVVLLVIDLVTDATSDPRALFPELDHWLAGGAKLLLVYNKIDALGAQKQSPAFQTLADRTLVTVSAKSGEGLGVLKEQIKKMVGFETVGEDGFLARRRHLVQLEAALAQVTQALHHLTENEGLELVAESLRLAQGCMDEITGRFTTDDLLGKIFAEFCIGK